MSKTFRALGTLLDYQRCPGGMVFFTDNEQVQVRFLKSGKVEVLMERNPRPTCGVAPDSGAVIGDRDYREEPAIFRQDGQITMESQNIRIVINEEPLMLGFFDKNGTALCQEDPSGGLGWYGSRGCLRKILKPDEKIYGLGEKTGYLDKRGQRMEMWNTDVNPYHPSTDPLYMSIPFLVAHSRTGSYGLFVDSPARSVWDLGKTAPGSYECITGESRIKYYFFAGPTLKDILSQYTEMTGRMSLPPYWALGYHQSRYSYRSRSEVERVAANLRENGIPCDAIHLDIHYMDGFRVFTFDPKAFPDPSGMIGHLNQQGFHVVPIVDPGVKIDEEYGPYLRGLADDHFVRGSAGQPVTVNVWPGEVHLPDFLQPETRGWWAEEHRILFDAGVSGIWNDMNEPAAFDTPGKTLPGGAVHGRPFEEVPHELVHNLYANRMAEATVQAFAKFRPGERSFVISRAGYAGIQRYACSWTGDNSSWWEHLELAIPMCLNLGMSGQPFVGTDVGGFLFDSQPELLARWTQLGAFMPLFRNHSSLGTVPQEPYTLDQPYRDVCIEAIRLRYRLIPYLYTLMHEAARTGYPVMRPMVLEYPDIERTHTIYDQFMFGPDLLVAPVCRPGTVCRHVFLPPGYWADWHCGIIHQGQVDILTDAPLETIPLFLKEGSIIPLGRVMNFTGEKEQTVEWLDVFPGECPSGHFELYADDGISSAWQNGDSAYGRFRFDRSDDRRLTIEAVWEGNHRKYGMGLGVIRVFGMNEAPVGVMINGSAVVELPEAGQVSSFRGWFFDSQSGRVLIGVHAGTEAIQVTLHGAGRPGE